MLALPVVSAQCLDGVHVQFITGWWDTMRSKAACDSFPHHPLRDVQRYQDAVHSPAWVAHQMSHVVPTGPPAGGVPIRKAPVPLAVPLSYRIPLFFQFRCQRVCLCRQCVAFGIAAAAQTLCRAAQLGGVLCQIRAVQWVTLQQDAAQGFRFGEGTVRAARHRPGWDKRGLCPPPGIPL